MYLFGSVLEKKHPHDIDLVLIYRDNFSAEMMQLCNIIRDIIFRQFAIEAHLTVLSSYEEKETQFLRKIKSMRIK